SQCRLPCSRPSRNRHDLDQARPNFHIPFLKMLRPGTIPKLTRPAHKPPPSISARAGDHSVAVPAACRPPIAGPTYPCNNHGADTRPLTAPRVRTCNKAPRTMSEPVSAMPVIARNTRTTRGAHAIPLPAAVAATPASMTARPHKTVHALTTRPGRVKVLVQPELAATNRAPTAGAAYR